MARKIINALNIFLVRRSEHINDLYIIKYIYDNDIEETIDTLLQPLEDNHALDYWLVPISQKDHPTATHAIAIDTIIIYLIVNTASIIVTDVAEKRIYTNKSLAA